jgi:hypothetical protein
MFPTSLPPCFKEDAAHESILVHHLVEWNSLFCSVLLEIAQSGNGSNYVASNWFNIFFNWDGTFIFVDSSWLRAQNKYWSLSRIHSGFLVSVLVFHWFFHSRWVVVRLGS